MSEVVPFSSMLLASHLVVDVRTPLEFAEDHLPGAINVPLLSNEERVEIGTLYKQTGPHQARVRGLELTAARFPGIVRQIAAAAQGRPILVYCWRGGLRSKTVASILGLTGYKASQLAGGYKAFRAEVTGYFETFAPPGPLVVLHGLTGLGKTHLLALLQAQGEAVIDLEAIASHRGSAFGALGLVHDLTQKHFETLLWDAFRKLHPGRPVFIEGESRRIGRVLLPGSLYDVMRDGTLVWCEASIATRVQRLIEEYGLPAYKEGMADALLRIRKKLGGEKYLEISGYLERWELEPFMTELLNNYYDKLYYKTREWQEDLTISLEDLRCAANELRAFIARPLPH